MFSPNGKVAVSPAALEIDPSIFLSPSNADALKKEKAERTKQRNKREDWAEEYNLLVRGYKGPFIVTNIGFH